MTPFWTHQINKKLGLSPALCNPTKEEEEGEGEGVRIWLEASEATASRLARGESLARLSGTFVKGCRLPLGEAPEGGVAPPRA